MGREPQYSSSGSPLIDAIVLSVILALFWLLAITQGN